MADKEKQIQIPQRLFAQMLAYFLLDREDVADDIKNGLNAKLDAMTRHELYTTYKTAPTSSEREKARKEYLDKIGVSEDFRW